MRDYADDANLHARIYALKSRLLSLPDYVYCASNTEQLIYGNAAGAADDVAKGEIIFREQIAPLLPLVEAVGIYKPLFLAFFRQFEAVNVKLILAKSFGLHSLEQWYDIEPYAIVKRNLLRETTDLQNIRLLLAGTYLAPAFEDVSSYERMEINVDLCVARSLYDASALFSPEAKLDFQELIGRRIAVTSMILSLRLKQNYHWDDAKTHAYLTNFYNAFDGNIWPQVKIVEDALDQYLQQTREGGRQEQSVVDVEHYLERYYCRLVSSMFHRDYFSIYCVAAYLWLLFYQIRNLFKIIEGRRFGYSPERIISRIVCNN